MKAQFWFILLAVMILHTAADNQLIDRTCNRTPDYRFCTSIILANPAGAAASDVAGLVLIVVDVIKQKTNEALSIISKSRHSPALQRCSEVYKAVRDGDIPVVSQTIRGNPKSAEKAVADAGNEARICDVALRKAGANLPHLRKLNNYVPRVADIARAIITNLL